jgi:multiple sugar transport system permease protein
VLVYPTFTIPFCTWLFLGFFKSVPRDRGGGDRRSAARILRLRQDDPAAIRAAHSDRCHFAFTLTMQEFGDALTFISSSDQKPVTLGVTADPVRSGMFYLGELMAAAPIASVPAAIAYKLFLDRCISGITDGAVKWTRPRPRRALRWRQLRRPQRARGCGAHVASGRFRAHMLN